MNRLEYTLGREELTLLLWLLQYPTLPGLGDKPLGDANSVQTSAMLATAERSLRARGWLEIPGRGRFEIQSELEELITSCAKPDITIRFLVMRAQSEGEVFHFHIKGNRVFIHNSLSHGVHQLIEANSRNAISEIIQDKLWSIPPVSGSKISFELADSSLAAARVNAREENMDAALSTLRQDGIYSEMAEGFILAMAAPITECSLFAYSSRAEFDPGELVFLESTNGVWMITTATEIPGIHRLRVHLVDAPQASQDLKVWLEKYIHFPV